MSQATVRARQGRTVPQFGQQNFEVFEDGRPQPIRLFRHEDTPVTVGLVIDHSGSMREKLADVTAGAQAFVHSSNPSDQMFVVNFNEAVSLGLVAESLRQPTATALTQHHEGHPGIGNAVSAGVKSIEPATC